MSEKIWLKFVRKNDYFNMKTTAENYFLMQIRKAVCLDYIFQSSLHTYSMTQVSNLIFSEAMSKVFRLFTQKVANRLMSYV